MILKDYEKKNHNQKKVSQFLSLLFPGTWVKFPLVRDLTHPICPQSGTCMTVLQCPQIFYSARILQVNETQFLKAAKKHLNVAHNYVCS